MGYHRFLVDFFLPAVAAGKEVTVGRLDFIHRGRIAGLTLDQIRDILRVRDPGDAPCIHVRDLLTKQLTDLDRQIAELVALRSAVADYHGNVAVADPVDCDPDLICSYL